MPCAKFSNSTLLWFSKEMGVSVVGRRQSVSEETLSRLEALTDDEDEDEDDERRDKRVRNWLCTWSNSQQFFLILEWNVFQYESYCAICACVECKNTILARTVEWVNGQWSCNLFSSLSNSGILHSILHTEVHFTQLCFLCERCRWTKFFLFPFKLKPWIKLISDICF